MTWTYSGDPKNSETDYVRFLCGDTEENSPLLSDEEIQFLLAEHGGPKNAAQHACLSIIAKLAREVDYAIGPEKVSASQRLKHYQKLMADLRTARISANAAPSWSGTPYQNEPAIFDIGMHDSIEGDE